MIRRSLLVVVVALWVSTVAAEEPASPATRPARAGATWSLGAAFIQAPNPYVGVSTKTLVIPMVGLQVGRFSLQGIGVGVELLDSHGFRLDASTNLRFGGYSASDSPALSGMAGRKFTIESGLRAGWERPWVGLEAAFTTDILGRSNGQEVSFDVLVPIRLGYAQVRPSVGVVWQSAPFVDYYYGVRLDEATLERPAYEPGASTSLRAGINAIWPLTRKLAAVGFVRAEFFASVIRSSPIVDRDRNLTSLLAISFRF